MNTVSILFYIAITLLFAATGCTFPGQNGGTTAASPPPEVTAITIVAATHLQCPSGGSVMELFKDSNANGLLDANETVISTTPICDGVQGSQGVAGMSAGVEVKTAGVGSCPAGGTIVNTFQDHNSNGVLDSAESIVSSSTICNGTNGSNGKSSIIITSTASTAECSAGGVVYTTQVDGEPAQVSIVCNGINGSNGSNAVFEMGPVGSPVLGKSYTACHHDYVYIPNAQDPNKGWLIFRHQKNGSADQGIGSTGFNVWDVDIADFLLASEAGGVNYCSLHWDSITKVLTYNVVDNSDGHAGENGSIQL